MTENDHLAVWQRVRARVPWADLAEHPRTPVRAVRDGYLDHLHATAGRDPDRARRLLEAYRAVRSAASSGARLTPGRTAHWNAITRGADVAVFRRGVAYAKQGRERYGLTTTTEQEYAACLTESADPAVPAPARAARVYLDVAFFHPYDDGNARLAGLALQFVLLSARIELDDLTPVLITVRRADDAAGAAGLARMVHGIAAATRRRHLRATGPVTPAVSAGSR